MLDHRKYLKLLTKTLIFTVSNFLIIIDLYSLHNNHIYNKKLTER